VDIQSFIKWQKEKIHIKSKNRWVSDLFASSSNSWLSSKNWWNSDMSISALWDKKEDNGIITLVNDVFLNALYKKASDIHIEPREKNIKIRFRVDGRFINYKDLDIQKISSIIARIKIMSYLRIDEHRLPQDWKISYKLFGGKTVDMRISILPYLLIISLKILFTFLLLTTSIS